MGRRTSILSANNVQERQATAGGVRLLASKIRHAIHDGAKVFNDGQHQVCYDIYLATAYGGLSQETMHMSHMHNNKKDEKTATENSSLTEFSPGESQYICSLLTKATLESTKLVGETQNYTEAAWILRRAFDNILKVVRQHEKGVGSANESEANVKERVETASEAEPSTVSTASSSFISTDGTEEAKAESLAKLCNAMADMLDIGDHKFRLKTYPNTFVGKEAVSKLVETGLCLNRKDALFQVNELLRYGLVHHVTNDHTFKDEELFYKLTTVHDLKKQLDAFGSQLKSLQGDKLIHYATLLGRYKQFHKHPSLGVLRLDYDYPPAPGDIDHPDSYDYPVYYRVVPGLTFEMCQEGKLTPEVAQAFDEAVLWLANHKDVSVITGDCGFMFWFVEHVRHMVSSRKIISLSPLMQLPTMVAACAPTDKILVLTANGTSLDPMHDLIKRQCGIDGQDTQFVFVGCENVPHFGVEVAKGLKVNVALAEPGIVELAKDCVKKHPDARMILFECTELPPYSDAVREATRLPVMDAITNCDFFMNGFLDNANFGLNGWYEAWDGVQEDYVLGQNLDDTQRLQCVWCKNNELAYTK